MQAETTSNLLQQVSQYRDALLGNTFFGDNEDLRHHTQIENLVNLHTQAHDSDVSYAAADAIVTYLGKRRSSEEYHPNPTTQRWAFTQLADIAQVYHSVADDRWADIVIDGIGNRVNALERGVFENYTEIGLRDDAVDEFVSLHTTARIFGRENNAARLIAPVLVDYVKKEWSATKIKQADNENLLAERAFRLLVSWTQGGDSEIRRLAEMTLESLWNKFSQEYLDLRDKHILAIKLVDWGTQLGIGWLG